MRIIIAGSRSFDDYPTMVRAMETVTEVWKPSTVVCGCARGADELGRRWANENGIPVDEYPANWEAYGKAAGRLRNEAMANNADCLVAFWDGSSTGTKHMVELARERGLKNIVFMYRKP